MFFPLFVLVLAPLALAKSFSFSFSPNPIQQCKPVTIKFAGLDADDSLPQSLSLFPFGIQPISIPINGATSESEGISLSFLPIKAGTQFIASLDDSNGDNASKVSDIFSVVDSDDSSCLPANYSVPPFAVSFPNSTSQCEPFNLVYDPARDPPAIRVFIPTQISFLLNSTSSTSRGNASYVAPLPRFAQALMVAVDSDTMKITDGVASPGLITVGGDASSPTNCFKPTSNSSTNNSGANKKNMESNSGSTKTNLSTGVIVGIALASIFVGIFLVLLFIFALRLRRRRAYRLARERAQVISFHPSMLERRSSASKSFYSYNGAAAAAGVTTLGANGRDVSAFSPSVYNGDKYSEKAPDLDAQSFSPFTATNQPQSAKSLGDGYRINPAYTSRRFSSSSSINDDPNAGSIQTQVLSPLRSAEYNGLIGAQSNVTSPRSIASFSAGLGSRTNPNSALFTPPPPPVPSQTSNPRGPRSINGERGADLSRSLSAKAASTINSYDIEQMLNFAAAANRSSDREELITTSSLNLPGNGSSASLNNAASNPFLADNGPLSESPDQFSVLSKAGADSVSLRPPRAPALANRESTGSMSSSVSGTSFVIEEGEFEILTRPPNVHLNPAKKTSNGGLSLNTTNLVPPGGAASGTGSKLAPADVPTSAISSPYNSYAPFGSSATSSSFVNVGSLGNISTMLTPSAKGVLVRVPSTEERQRQRKASTATVSSADGGIGGFPRPRKDSVEADSMGRI